MAGWRALALADHRPEEVSGAAADWCTLALAGHPRSAGQGDDALHFIYVPDAHAPARCMPWYLRGLGSNHITNRFS